MSADVFEPVCRCAWLGAGTPRHVRSALCFDGVWSGPPAPYPGNLPTDPNLFRRRAERQRADRVRASRALDRFIDSLYAEIQRELPRGGDFGKIVARPCTYPTCNVGDGATCGRQACVERKHSEYGE